MIDLLSSLFGRVSIFSSALSTILIAAPAHAASCGKAGANSEAGNLQRQINANRNLLNKYNCSTEARFVCREIQGRITAATASLARATGSDKCATGGGERQQRRGDGKEGARIRAKQATPIATMCVRLSDGYYFPTPNSGSSSAKDLQGIVAQCKFICQDPLMDVYEVTGDERDDMRSLATGETYADLRSAGLYRLSAKAKRCDMNRFYKMALQARTTGSAKSAATADIEEQRVTTGSEMPVKEIAKRPSNAQRKIRVISGSQFAPTYYSENRF